MYAAHNTRHLVLFFHRLPRRTRAIKNIQSIFVILERILYLVRICEKTTSFSLISREKNPLIAYLGHYSFKNAVFLEKAVCLK